jgi:tryptophan-rich sensory protein
MDKKFIPYLLIFLPIILGLGSSAVLIPEKKIPKVRSKWNPPAWVFAVVWPILYLLLGYSSYLIWKKNGGKIDGTLQNYILHLILLLCWWPYFVYFPNRDFATISLFLLAIHAIYLASVFYNKDEIAGYCWIPYIIWLSFATFLTSKSDA